MDDIKIKINTPNVNNPYIPIKNAWSTYPDIESSTLVTHQDSHQDVASVPCQKMVYAHIGVEL